MEVLGQADAMPRATLDIGQYLGFVTIELTGPDGTAHATLSPDQADKISLELRKEAAAARDWQD